MEQLFSYVSKNLVEVNYLEMIFKMFLSTLLGALISFHWAQITEIRQKVKKMKVAKAKVILCLAGTVMVIVIGDNVARAFGLFGLGSFIRFRTSLEDAVDTAIIFLLIGIGMAVGIGLYVPSIIVFTFLYGILYVFSKIKTSEDEEEAVEQQKVNQKTIRMADKQKELPIIESDTVLVTEKNKETNQMERIVDKGTEERVDEKSVDEIEKKGKSTKRKVCPSCAENVKAKIVFCKSCGYKFTDDIATANLMRVIRSIDE